MPGFAVCLLEQAPQAPPTDNLMTPLALAARLAVTTYCRLKRNPVFT